MGGRVTSGEFGEGIYSSLEDTLTSSDGKLLVIIATEAKNPIVTVGYTSGKCFISVNDNPQSHIKIDGPHIAIRRDGRHIVPKSVEINLHHNHYYPFTVPALTEQLERIFGTDHKTAVQQAQDTKYELVTASE